MEQESQGTDLLYDFLYIDTRRASTLITQLYAPGVVSSIKHISSEEESKQKSGGVDVKVANGAFSVEEAINRTQEKLFDASWSLPINLLDKLSESNLITSGITDRKLGNLVLIKGKISFFDISFLQKSIPFMEKLLLSQVPKKPNQKKIKPEDLQLVDGLTLGMVSSLLDIVPDTLQIDFIDDNKNNIWMTIDKRNFTINPDDMVLKYGSKIPGEWYALGLVDALPEASDEDNEDNNEISNPLKDGLKQILSGIKESAGRTNNSYGMTPLILFRKIE
ncbi:hypothetical protein LZX53_005036 [Salmonella enterica]|nr:hypothetical protein [Salmonella enterica subsp. enterica serovar Florida]EDE2392522.1 hypothetical protein [Salmonella enterica]ECF4168493.1 hypothetical protein [Salmonella enterica subsp. enterica serovar Florida]ECW2477215.1 hypothetical protein [Salmonella enterica subsp. enterica serovar Florida]EDZ6281142.1 hypothetical protein [Salmonella enterica]